MKASPLAAAVACSAVFGLFGGAVLLAPPAFAEEVSNLPPDPFVGLEEVPKAQPYPIEVDRSRGSFLVPAEDGQYVAGSHFGNWSWVTQVERWGNYYVGLVYDSSRPKMGVQIRVGTDAVLKGYAPRTHELREDDPLVLGTAYIAEPGELPIAMLTADQSNVEAFQIRGVHFQPAPESEPLGQSIDGTIELLASHAATYAERLRYEPAEDKDCLGYWTDEQDWAEWVFPVSSPGTFRLELHYGCGPGSGGSEVTLLVNGQALEFTVEETGGFQDWQAKTFDSVEIPTAGEQRIALVPKSLAGKAVMDVSKLVLTPVAE